MLRNRKAICRAAEIRNEKASLQLERMGPVELELVCPNIQRIENFWRNCACNLKPVVFLHFRQSDLGLGSNFPIDYTFIVAKQA